MGARIYGGGSSGGGGGDVFLAGSPQVFTGGGNQFEQPLILGSNGSTNGTLRFEDLAGSGFVSSIAPPAAGFSANRSIVLPDIGGGILMVGTSAVTTSGGSPASGTVGKVDIAARTTAIASTGITNSTPAGMYMVSAQIACTVAGAGTISLTMTAATDGGTRNIVVVTTNMAAVGLDTNTQPIYLASGNVTFTTAFSTSPVGSGTYVTRVRCSFLG